MQNPQLQQQTGRSVFLGNYKGGNFKIPSFRNSHIPRKNQTLLLHFVNTIPNGSNNSLPKTASSASLESSKSRSNSVEQLTMQPLQRGIGFTSLSFSKYLLEFAAIDQRGNLYLFDLKSCKFQLVARIGISGVCMCFGGNRRHEVYVGLSDTSIHVYNTNTYLLSAKLAGHGKGNPCLHVSAHPTKPIMLSVAQSNLIIYDIDKWQKKRVLAGVNNMQLVQAMFDPSGELIVAMFDDASIMMWNVETFDPVWKVDLKDDLKTTTEMKSSENCTSPIAFSHDGSFMAGCLNMLAAIVYVWDVGSKSLLHEIKISDNDQFFGIKDVAFVGKSNILAILQLNGDFLFVDVVAAERIDIKQELVSKTAEFSISHDGKYFVTISQEHSALALWDCERILKEKVDGDKEKEDISLGKSSESLTKKNDDAERNCAGKMDYSNLTEVPNKITISQKELDKIISVSPNNSLSFSKLSVYLLHFGEFPEKYRLLIWRFLLQIPENRDAYDALLKRGIHPCYKLFRRKYPMKSERIARSMETVLSCLAFWSPLFEDLDTVPTLVFPFVKTFKNDSFACFETMLSVIVNWCQLWWEFYPNPPIQVLDIVEDMLEFHDRNLLNHFRRHQVSSQVYAWPLLSSFFSDILGRNDWLITWDHILLNQPDYIFYVVIALLKSMRGQLFQITRQADFKFFTQRTVIIDIKRVVQVAYSLAEKTPLELRPKMPTYKPLIKGHYPLFNKYPEHIVNYQKKLRERIKVEEEELQKKKQIAAELAKYTNMLKNEQKAWAHAEDHKSRMLETWWDSILEEEGKHVDRKMKLSMLENEKRLDAFKELEKTDHDVEYVKQMQEHRRRELMDKILRKSKTNEKRVKEISQFDNGINVLTNEMESKMNKVEMKRRNFDNREDNVVLSKLKELGV